MGARTGGWGIAARLGRIVSVTVAVALMIVWMGCIESGQSPASEPGGPDGVVDPPVVMGPVAAAPSAGGSDGGTPGPAEPPSSGGPGSAVPPPAQGPGTGTLPPAGPTVPPPPPPAGARGFDATANSARAVAAGTRYDPEGVAFPANVNRIAWNDSRGAERSLTLGAYLYQYDFTFDDNQQVVSRSANDAAWGHPGFGYVVSHNTLTGNSPLGKINVPTRVESTVLAGGHHAIHRVELLYRRDQEGGGMGIAIPVVIEWFVATGRDHPVWSVTWKAGEIVNPQNVDLDAYRMDVRGPYGSLNFDGAANRNAGDAIGGVAWGDFGLKFTTTDGQLTLNSPWTYDTANRVAFTQMWTANVNAEMGIVQTRPGDKEMGYPDRVFGRERGATSASNFAGRGDCNGFGDNRAYVMPCVSGWPYQLMNYDWDASTGKPAGEATGTKLIAWGTPYGWLGASRFDLFDYSGTADGRGDRSYATFIVLGPRARFDAGAGQWTGDGDVARTIRTVEALTGAELRGFSAGSAAAQAPRGPGASQMKPLVNGYDDTYAVFRLAAQDGAVRFTFAPAAGKVVSRPVFVVGGYTSRALPNVSVGGTAVSVNDGTSASGAFVSLNEATNELWVTLNRDVGQATEVVIAAPGASAR